MNRALHAFNLAGVLILAVLCASQWRLNRHLNLEVARLEQIRTSQHTKLDERDATIRGYAADLDDLRSHLTRLTAEIKESEGLRRHTDLRLSLLASERDQLAESIPHWTNAVMLRDEQIREANQQIRQLAADCNQAISKFNELAGQYNAVVEDLNERTRQFNELAARQSRN